MTNSRVQNLSVLTMKDLNVCGLWTLYGLTLEVTAALETVPPSDIEPYTGLPNKYFPSDHLSLKAYFKFASMKNKNEF